MAEFLVSPAEPTPVKSLGRVSIFPEKVGADVYFVAEGKSYGVQRKELADLIQSFGDRLPREAMLLSTRVTIPILIIEGRGNFTRDGKLIRPYGGQQFSKEQLRRLILSVQYAGIWVIQTDNIEETVVAILDIRAWAKAEKHQALISRGGPPPAKPTGERTSWRTKDPNVRNLNESRRQKLSKRELDAWVLQGFPMIGPEMALRIVDHFGGLPLRWAFDEAELQTVPGIGPKRARSLMTALPPSPEMISVADTSEEVKPTKRKRTA